MISVEAQDSNRSGTLGLSTLNDQRAFDEIESILARAVVDTHMNETLSSYHVNQLCNAVSQLPPTHLPQLRAVLLKAFSDVQAIGNTLTSTPKRGRARIRRHKPKRDDQAKESHEMDERCAQANCLLGRELPPFVNSQALHLAQLLSGEVYLGKDDPNVNEGQVALRQDAKLPCKPLPSCSTKQRCTKVASHVVQFAESSALQKRAASQASKSAEIPDARHDVARYVRRHVALASRS